MDKRWVAKPLPAEEIIETLYAEMDGKVASIYVTMMAQRNINTLNGARTFFNPDISQLHDPYLMKDMNKAVERIKIAIEANEKILVYGDYDVDGTTAVAVVYSCLKKVYDKLDFYIPDRFTEGYGVSNQSVEWAKENNISLIITLDCGIKATEQVALGKNYGIDFIICDHHQPDEELPDAVAILNPKQPDCHYPYKELSGCGIGYKLVQGLEKHYPLSPEEYIDLVAISIAADIVPLTGENRILAYFGLKRISNSPRRSLKTLMEIAGIRNPASVTIDDLVFKVGPRINAAGRMASGAQAVEMLIEEDDEKVLSIASRINDNNFERQGYDQNITSEALAMIENNEDLQKRKSTVLFKEDWHKGVIGIVASRLIEKYYRPTVLLTESNGMAVGSARSVPGYDLYSALNECSGLLDKWGGHIAAAGVTMFKENINAFTDKFEEVVSRTITQELLTPVIEYDLEISYDAITENFCKTLERFGPFGPQNMKPMFVLNDVYCYGTPAIVGNNHLQFSLASKSSATSHKAIAFGFGDMHEKVKNASSMSLIFHVEPNEFRGKYSVSINVKDIRINS